LITACHTLYESDSDLYLSGIGAIFWIFKQNSCSICPSHHLITTMVRQGIFFTKLDIKMF
jgi:hypothetical protein